MRRADREITDRAELLAVLDRCDTIRIGFAGEEYPYVVPLSFGWETENGRVVLWVHGATEGKRHRLLQTQPRVCVEADLMHGYARCPGGLTCEFESLIGFGTAELAGGEEARHGLALLCAHCGFEGFRCEIPAEGRTSVWKVTLNELTGKRRKV